MVGGVVRDFITLRPIHDIDFLVQGEVFPLVESLQKQFGGTLHKETLFEAAHWSAPDGNVFDFTVARSEWYPSPATLPITQKGTILDDILRRDFSINSMLISIQESGLGYIIDATNGMQDIQKKSLRILHKQSFRDDPTRIFRAARYAGRYQLTRSPNTQKAMEECLTHQFFNELPYEQIGKEIQKIFKEDDPNAAWTLLQEWNVIKHLFPNEEISLQKSLQAWNDINKKEICPQANRSLVLWITIITGVSCSSKYSALTNVIKGGGKLWSTIVPKLTKVMTQLPKAKNHGEIGAILHKLTPESLIYLYISNPDSVTWWLRTGQKQKSVVDGAWLIKEGCPKGPLFGDALRKAQHAAWMGYAHEEQRKIAKNVWTQ